jgi:hypothetical protein
MDVLVISLIALGCAAQHAPTPQAEPAAGEPGPAPPSLDDLLEIETDDDQGAAEAADQSERGALQRALDEAEIGDVFEVALEQMALSAKLLDELFDPGLETQRVQEEIIARLNELIDRAPNQSQQSSGSRSSSSSSQQPGSTPPARTPNQASQPNPGEQAGPADNTREGEPPPPQDASPNIILDESRREWGSLPERIRDMMLQGQSGFKSSLYRSLTEEYYRRLAEEQ